MRFSERIDRRRFLKGIGFGGGALALAGVQGLRARGQEVTFASLYARLAGSEAPPIQLGLLETDAWICQGEKVELFWVTTSDVRQVDIGPDVGTFAADAGGQEGDLKWGSVEVQPERHTSYVLEALGGTYEIGAAAGVRVFFPPGAEQIQMIQEEAFSARRPIGGTRGNKDNVWIAPLTADRFSPRLRFSEIKPIGAAAPGQGFPFDWGVTKTDLDGTVHEFHLAPTPSYQRPFAPPGTNRTLQLAGHWEFRVARSGPPNRVVQFMVKLTCS